MNELGASVLSTATLLFFLMDPIGNIPVLLAVLKGIPPKRQRLIIIRELCLALALLLLFLFGGKSLLNFLHLQQEAVSVAGGIILMIIGLRLIFPRPEGVMGHQPEGEPFLVPIAIPMIAGPSVLAMLILMTQNSAGSMLNWFMALMLAWGTAAIILLTAPFFMKVLKQRGLTAMERLMGMLLVMMSVQMLINGVKELFHIV